MSYGPDTTGDFVARYGSVTAAEARARSIPGIGEEIRKVERWLAGLAAHAYESTRPWSALDVDERAYRREVGFAPREFVAAEGARLQALREDLIVAALAAELADAAPATRRQRRERARPVRRGDPGSPDTFYGRDEIKRALVLWRSRDSSPQKISQSSIARKSFPRTAVRRVIRLDEHGAFELGPSGGLRLRGINGEFRAAPKMVSLRALERALGLKPFGRS